IKEMIGAEIDLLISELFADTATMKKELAQLLPLKPQTVTAIAKQPDAQSAIAKAQDAALKAYESRAKDIGPDALRQLEREVYLQTLDMAWMQHLENMQHLREGIGWRSIGQKDPLVEYRREGKQYFEAMETQLRTDIVKLVFKAEPPKSEEEAIETELTRAAANAVELGSAAADSTQTKEKRRTQKP